MDDVAAADAAVDSPPRRRWRMRVAAISGGVAAIALLGLWIERKPIAEGFIDRELAKRGVPATYKVAQIGFQRQRLTDVVIGDPRDPDLTARSVEVTIVAGLTGVEVTGLSADGVRLKAGIRDGTLSLGALDRLLPPPSGKPFTLPDLFVRLRDARVRLETPAGRVGLKVEGAGSLTDGFDGRIAAVADTLVSGGCTVARANAWVRVTIRDREPSVSGPVRAAEMRCGDVRLAGVTLAPNVTLEEALDRWRGRVGVNASAVGMGRQRLSDVTGTVDVDGGRERSTGDLRLTARGFATPQVAGQGLMVAGGFALSGTARRFEGSVAVREAKAQAGLETAGRAAAGTPLGPIAAQLATVATRAAQRFGGRAAIAGEERDGEGWASLSGLTLTSASGARLLVSDGDGIVYRWPEGRAEIDGLATIQGGGLPAITARVAQAGGGGPIRGTAIVAPLTAGDSRLALSGVTFDMDGKDSIRFATRIDASGPIGDGRVDNLALPIEGSWSATGGLTLNRDCTPLSFRRLAISGLVLDPARLRLCPVEGALVRSTAAGTRAEMRLAATRLTGRIGGTPLSLALTGADASLARSGFGVSGVAVRLGDAERVTRLDLARVEGRARGSAVEGSFTGGDGKIANVPLLVSEAAGQWRLSGGVLDVNGRTVVSDEAEDPRFEPLTAPDMRLRLAGNAITATGTLSEPTTGRAVTDVTIAHDLGAGTGKADLAVPGVTFDKALQPEKLTRLTLGVAANVRGTLSGEGHIRWSPQGVSSDGVFRTSGANLAAAFGPVTNLTTELRFTDLLGLASAPGQVATVGEVNPGVAVTDGVIRYQLLPEQRVAIEGGRWPFAGGELILEPTVLDFGQEAERDLTFTVAGLDAAKFIAQLEFENIAATGTFDGKLPMVFDANGGRIEDGSLVVRPGGGTLAYVGEVSNADLGTWGKLAFDALKSIKYDRLRIDLDGALDGEIISQIRFNGVNQGTLEGGQAGFFREFIGLPFLFNITVRAPFRGLVSTARSFTDPGELIRSQLPELDSSTKTIVQPQESETVP